MTRSFRKAGAAIIATWTLVASPGLAQELPRPASWQWVLDAPAEHQAALDPTDGKWTFGVMAPGWHITTRPGVILFDPSYRGRGRFSLEAETFLFPGASQSGVGLMLGGQELGGAASYFAFLIRRDGSVAIEQRAAGRRSVVVDWQPAAAVVRGSPDHAVKNLLRVDIDSGVAQMSVNGKVVARVDRSADEFAGVVGLRIGPDLNLHVTNLDLTHKLALPAKPR